MTKLVGFDSMTEGAKWAVYKLLTFIPRDKLWKKPEDCTVDIHIEIQGTVVENPAQFFEDIVSAYEETLGRGIRKGIADALLERFGKVDDGWDELYADAERALKEKLEKEYDVRWDFYGHLYDDKEA